MSKKQFISKPIIKKGGEIMKAKLYVIWAAVIVFLISWGIMPVSVVNAQENLRFSCSAQVYEAFEKELLNEYTRDTGINVDLFVSSSGSAVYRLMMDYSDIAATVRELYRRHRDYGFVQIPFCKDPLTIITKKGCGVDSISEHQLREIFSGDISNWKELGGVDMPIVLVVPNEDTGANKNFRRQVMKHKEIKYDFLAYKSTNAIELVRNLPCGSISFISHGVVIKDESLKVLRINGLHPKDKNYPYYQIFYFITKGEPTGAAKKLIDFASSEKGKALMKKKGMSPVQ